MNSKQPTTKSFDAIYADYSNPNGRVMITAHRGNWRQAPENSVLAIQCSIDAGVDVVEVDVQRTKDGRLVLMHDDTVDRMTDGSGRISELTFDAIRALQLKEGQGGEDTAATAALIPTLHEVMLLAKDKVMVNLDKCWHIREDVYQVLVNTGTVKQGLFKSTAGVEEVQEFLSGKSERPEFMQLINGSNAHLLDQTDEIITRVQPKAFELNFAKDDSPVISDVTLRRLKGKCRIWVNTMFDADCGGHTDAVSLTNPKLGWDWHLGRGVNMIQTDSPKELYAHLNPGSK
ncbi:glycerophosphodiester phosphodiesterase family protein [Paenibacillus xerothermodurans]|nr:glycerophosphodiester phosphodiesterase family protein [Paenibacillus xerothermodurans]